MRKLIQTRKIEGVEVAEVTGSPQGEVFTTFPEADFGSVKWEMMFANFMILIRQFEQKVVRADAQKLPTGAWLVMATVSKTGGAK